MYILYIMGGLIIELDDWQIPHSSFFWSLESVFFKLDVNQKKKERCASLACMMQHTIFKASSKKVKSTIFASKM